jgi:hypothetical protein
MAAPIMENIAKTNADALAESSRAAGTIMKGGAGALTESGNALESGCSGVDHGFCAASICFFTGAKAASNTALVNLCGGYR